MITKVQEIPVTETSYPFASAEKLAKLSKRGYVEKEYYMYGTANVYRSVDEEGNVEVKTPDAPYVNRFIVRAPEKAEDCSGNVVVEIINPTAFMEIDRMWILGQKGFVRNGDIYVGITSKPNTIPKLLEFNAERYQEMSWKNPCDDSFPYDAAELIAKGTLPDLNPSYETGLFWDMLTDLAWMIREKDEKSPLKDYPTDYIYLTGWSQSACYMIRYMNSFAYRPEVARGGCVFDGYLAAGAPRQVVTPVNQYEADQNYSWKLQRVEHAEQPYIALQTESENGRFNTYHVREEDSDTPDRMFRIYDITGASHDTMYSLIDYYQNDKDMERIGVLPSYPGKEGEGNAYPSEILCAAAYRNLYRWVREGIGPNHCEKIAVDAKGENVKDALGNSIGGLRTCLLSFPTGSYSNTTEVASGMGNFGEHHEKQGLFGSQKAFSAGMLQEMYGSLEHYRELVVNDTKTQVSKGFVCREDAEELIRLAVDLAAERGLK